MQKDSKQPDGAGAVSSTRLLDGLYRFGKGRGANWLYIKDGNLWLPTSHISPMIWMMCGKPILIVEKRSFMRAADIIEEMPSKKDVIETIAAKHGVAV